MHTFDSTSRRDDTVREDKTENNRPVHWVFLRVFAVVYLAAFISFWTQAMGLIGADGIMPLISSMPQLEVNSLSTQLPSLIEYPTVFRWIGTSDLAIHVVCALGTLSSICLLFGLYPRLCIVLSWLLYLSVFTVARPFMAYQWDILLLEVSILALIFTPSQGLESTSLRRWASLLSLWLLRVALFKVVLSSGLVKINSLDPTWQNLTALDFHFWTQPIPHQLAWSIHHLGEPARHVGVWFNHFVELAVPWLILCSLSKRMLMIWCLMIIPVMLACMGEYSTLMVLSIGGITLTLWLVERILKAPMKNCDWGRRMAGLAIVMLMIMVGGSGNYGFFNLLTICMTLVCFRARDLRLITPNTLFKPGQTVSNSAQAVWSTIVLTTVLVLMPLNGIRVLELIGHRDLSKSQSDPVRQDDWGDVPWSFVRDVSKYYQKQWGALVLVNGYGLFARMTTQRYELSIEGSADGKAWRAYRFKYKPDQEQDLHFAGLHMPRVDWQMWFAALHPKCSSRWIFYFMDALFEGSKPVSSLLELNPFEDEPPTFLRIRKVRAHFATPHSGASTDRYWAFGQELEAYCPVIKKSDLIRSNLVRRPNAQR